MKKLFYMVALFCISSEAAKACDICGCGVGSYYMGILPEFRKRFFGLRYQQKGLLTHVNPDGSFSYLTSIETYRTVEVWGAWNVGSRFRLVGFIPFNAIEKTNQGVTSRKNGLGDIAVVGYYNLLKTDQVTDSSYKRVMQSLWVGGGVKAPTGSYNPADKATAGGEQNTFQLGSGSIDFTLNAMYDLRVQDAGINANVSYKINTANGEQYQYGNKLTANLLGYYKLSAGKQFTVAPNAGLLYEHAAKDYRNPASMVDESGGYSVMGTVGVEASFQRIGFGANFQTPFSQQLAYGMVKATNRGMVHVSLAF